MAPQKSHPYQSSFASRHSHGRSTKQTSASTHASRIGKPSQSAQSAGALPPLPQPTQLRASTSLPQTQAPPPPPPPPAQKPSSSSSNPRRTSSTQANLPKQNVSTPKAQSGGIPNSKASRGKERKKTQFLLNDVNENAKKIEALNRQVGQLSNSLLSEPRSSRSVGPPAPPTTSGAPKVERKRVPAPPIVQGGSSSRKRTSSNTPSRPASSRASYWENGDFDNKAVDDAFLKPF